MEQSGRHGCARNAAVKQARLTVENERRRSYGRGTETGDLRPHGTIPFPCVAVLRADRFATE
jgi:hypothetical protein